MKRQVDTTRSTWNKNISLINTKNIDENMLDRPDTYLYFVKNNYSNEYGDPNIILHGFKIVKETRCYYYLATGQKLNKELNGRTYASTPAKALEKATIRANKYMSILVRRGQNVAEFLRLLDPNNKSTTRELRDFERLVKSLKDPDDIPIEAFNENAFANMRLKHSGVDFEY